MSQVIWQFRAVGAEAVQAAFKSTGDAAEASARATQRAQRRSATGAEATAKVQEAAALFAGRTQVSEAQKSATAEQKAREKALSHVAKVRERYFVQAQRDSERLERAETKATQRRMAMEERARVKQRKERWGKLGGDVGGAAKGLALTAGAAFTATIGAATLDSIKLQEKANRISINSRGAGEEYADPTELRKQFEATAAATPGIRATDVADAVGKYISLTGDAKGALQGQQTFATVASATGTDIGDVAEAAASISKQFDVTGLEEMRDVLAALTAQGKAGSFELSDAAAQFQKLAAAGAAFGLDKGAAGAKTLGGLTQIARSGTGSADEAATSVTGMFAAFNSKQKELKSAGVSVFKDGKRRGIEDLIVESIAKVGGNNAGKKAAGLNQIFGEQGGKAINPLVNTYNDARSKAVGTEAEKTAIAMAAVREQLQKATNAPGTWADVVSDAARAQEDSSAKLTAAWERTTAMAGEQLAPAFADLIAKLQDSGAIDSSIEALGIFAAALGEVASFLKESGLIPEKKKTLEEQVKDADAKIAVFDRTNGDADEIRSNLDAMPEGPERDAMVAVADAKLAERQGLVDARNGIADKQWTKASDLPTGDIEEFKKNYAELGSGGVWDEGRASAIADGYRRGERENDWMANQLGENTDQTNYRHQFEGALTQKDILMATPAEKTDGAGGGDALAAMRAEMESVTAAAREAAAALKNVKPAPSVIPT